MSTANIPTSTITGEAARAHARAETRHRQALVMRGVYLVIALLGAVVMIFPVYWLIITALKQPSEVFTSPPILFPARPQFNNFPATVTSSALPDGNYFIYLWNSTWYTA